MSEHSTDDPVLAAEIRAAEAEARAAVIEAKAEADEREAAQKMVTDEAWAASI